MTVRGARTHRFSVEFTRNGVPEEEPAIYDVVAMDEIAAHLILRLDHVKEFNPLTDSWRVVGVELVKPVDPRHYHVLVHTGPTPEDLTGLGSAWATLKDGLDAYAGLARTPEGAERAVLASCDRSECWGS